MSGETIENAKRLGSRVDPYARYVDTPIQLDGVIKIRGAIVR